MYAINFQRQEFQLIWFIFTELISLRTIISPIKELQLAWQHYESSCVINPLGSIFYWLNNSGGLEGCELFGLGIIYGSPVPFNAEDGIRCSETWDVFINCTLTPQKVMITLRKKWMKQYLDSICPDPRNVKLLAIVKFCTVKFL